MAPTALAKSRPILVLFNPIPACPILSKGFEANSILMLARTSISPILAEREARTGWIGRLVGIVVVIGVSNGVF
jgi:hypothetical protein